MRTVDLIIFDLDGTLYSSTATTVGALECAVRDINERHGLKIPQPTEAEVMGGVGNAREDYVHGVLPAVPEEHVGEVADLIWHWEHELIVGGKGSLFPGILGGLERLKASGYELAVATNAGTSYMNFVLDYFDIRKYFSEASCAGEQRSGDKGDLITGIIQRLGVLPWQAVMVGDRSSDIHAAQKAGVWSVGCTWGFASSTELDGADETAGSFLDLLELLKGWPGRDAMAARHIDGPSQDW